MVGKGGGRAAGRAWLPAPCPVLSRPRPRVLVGGVPPCQCQCHPPRRRHATHQKQGRRRLSAAAGRRALVTGNFCFSVSVAPSRCCARRACGWVRRRRGPTSGEAWRGLLSQVCVVAVVVAVQCRWESGQRKRRKGWAFLVNAWLCGLSAYQRMQQRCY